MASRPPRPSRLPRIVLACVLLAAFGFWRLLSWKTYPAVVERLGPSTYHTQKSCPPFNVGMHHDPCQYRRWLQTPPPSWTGKNETQARRLLKADNGHLFNEEFERRPGPIELYAWKDGRARLVDSWSAAALKAVDRDRSMPEGGGRRRALAHLERHVRRFTPPGPVI